MTSPAFDFGQNWKEFSEHALTRERYEQAQSDFSTLLQDVPLEGKSFLDIGFGQGLTLLCALRAGARVHGLDINQKCAEAFSYNKSRLLPTAPAPEVAIGSVLDPGVVETVRGWQPAGFDVVHSWGVLHHTGRMWKAIDNAASLVRPGGHFILAIYNRHWSSLPWLVIKRVYVSMPAIIQKLMSWIFTPIIYLAKLLVTRRNPLDMERGMEFYYNVVDWVGGYPYEYASRHEIEKFMEARGFRSRTYVHAIVPIGCNEFVFQKVA